MRAALVQMTSGDSPPENLAAARAYVAEAASGGADIVLTPEVTNCVSSSRAHQNAVLSPEAEDPTLAGLRAAAAEHGVSLLIGSLALKTGDADGRFANRSFLIGPDGAIAARYDKIHMFDVVLSETEAYRESDGFRPGDAAVLADTPLARIGMTVCYDLRFGYLHRVLAQAGAQILTVPAAFAVPTGKAHWEVLLRARAIETGCFVLAPAQTGRHTGSDGRHRDTWGHAMAVDPWGRVIADAGTAPGVTLVDLDLGETDKARGRVPSLRHDREFTPPTVPGAG
ncbi:amidohydrolase [Meridianimarinicoccus roseus]|uniref:Amidohydrolase n=1 Tax=Meridianimarinicoccus roseus TaxID=2072018 RepID=A0A2V2LA89_9RHOB|nr:carbon-nitrogen hydrolase family protein [Meridianimarinicoccus roseus]PWR02175.1 amidohydrolase [Meridianimarinicoccus roseus]